MAGGGSKKKDEQLRVASANLLGLYITGFKHRGLSSVLLEITGHTLGIL